MGLTFVTVIIAIGLFSSTPITVLEPNRISIEDIWLNRFEGINYVKGRYDCTQFANDFRDTLNPYGLNVSIIYGKMVDSEDETHCWLDINGRWFETTSGQWVADKDRYKMFKYIHRCW